MTMSVSQHVIIIAIVVFGTMLTRFLPFLVFPSGKPTPVYVQYLGKVLPSAVIGLLVIYCFKDVSILTGTHGIPEFISVAVVAMLHFWKRSMFISIEGGTMYTWFWFKSYFRDARYRVTLFLLQEGGSGFWDKGPVPLSQTSPLSHYCCGADGVEMFCNACSASFAY